MRRSLVIGVVLALLALGLAFRFQVMTFTLYALTLTYVAAVLLARSSLDGVTCTRGIAEDRAEIGDTMTIRAMLRNEKALPIFWLLVEEVLPSKLLPRGDYLRLLVLGPRATRALEYRVTFACRGYHQIGPVILESGDLFGFVRNIRTARTAHYITVRPVPVPILSYDVATHRPIGEIRARKQIFEDPTRMAGVREYRVGDPLNRIDWRATARTGDLHSRVYEPTVLAGAFLVLDFHLPAYQGDAANGPASAGRREASPPAAATVTVADEWEESFRAPAPIQARSPGEASALFGEGDLSEEDAPEGPSAAPELADVPRADLEQGDPERRMELAVTVAASLACYVLDLKETAGILSNGLDALERVKREAGLEQAANRREARRLAEERTGDDRLRPVAVRPGRGSEKAAEILDALARLEPSEGLSLRQMLVEELQRLPRDLSLIIVTPQLGRELSQAVAALKFCGLAITVVLIDNPEAWERGHGLFSAQNVPVLHIRKPEDLAEIATRGL